MFIGQSYCLPSCLLFLTPPWHILGSSLKSIKHKSMFQVLLRRNQAKTAITHENISKVLLVLAHLRSWKRFLYDLESVVFTLCTKCGYFIRALLQSLKYCYEDQIRKCSLMSFSYMLEGVTQM